MRLEPGAQADPALDRIAVDGRPLPSAATLRYALLHKPRGYVSSRSDPEGRPVVVDLVPRELGRLYPVGRLDYDAEGLLLLTNDGALADQLLHPRYEIPRVYEALVEGAVGGADLGRWRAGAMLADGPARPKAVALLRRDARGSWLRLTFAEGRNREVKRYCKAMGHPVASAPARGVRPAASRRPRRWGSARPLTEREIAELKNLRGL